MSVAILFTASTMRSHFTYCILPTWTTTHTPQLVFLTSHNADKLCSLLWSTIFFLCSDVYLWTLERGTGSDEANAEHQISVQLDYIGPCIHCPEPKTHIICQTWHDLDLFSLKGPSVRSDILCWLLLHISHALRWVESLDLENKVHPHPTYDRKEILTAKQAGWMINWGRGL